MLISNSQINHQVGKNKQPRKEPFKNIENFLNGPFLDCYPLSVFNLGAMIILWHYNASTIYS
ncbi:hypothetical protein FC98_GL002802 [Lentilactobacillus kisonensis DSM 19906 = JCM 15041]|uniref:Uncharacterized protein n=2 Tax=Lentilactobacillus kisonensis TaxID=481722 RepID=H1LI12_9LACO|nr:hypothetical protein HMPREF9104_02253 [Lentilactobacillus kisonensis F0435]KRL22184.1 hypothetical protein FC98_GL002802 [Lentilactobacillus kisonensis DSM 19906 = JCM 15041]